MWCLTWCQEWVGASQKTRGCRKPLSTPHIRFNRELNPDVPEKILEAFACYWSYATCQLTWLIKETKEKSNYRLLTSVLIFLVTAFWKMFTPPRLQPPALKQENCWRRHTSPLFSIHCLYLHQEMQAPWFSLTKSQWRARLDNISPFSGCRMREVAFLAPGEEIAEWPEEDRVVESICKATKAWLLLKKKILSGNCNEVLPSSLYLDVSFLKLL